MLPAMPIDDLPTADAVEALTACCGSGRWVREVMARRPFGSREALRAASDRAFATLEKNDWLEAFAHHPRIGERHANIPVSDMAAQWSSGEQSAANSDPAALNELARANAQYDARFGFIFIVCATGLGTADIQEKLRARLANSAEEELSIAAREQRAITTLRLEKL
ncbi:MAG: 2-oxo-4-hydroxy-4-carboxy-5-ureidoimidazoline decarboxylase [bacterium]